MRAAAMVGRVGGLAVALGIGAALTVGAGVGLADDGTDTAGSSAPAGSTAASPDSPAAKTRGHKKVSTGPTKRLPASQDDPAPTKSVPAHTVAGSVAGSDAAEEAPETPHGDRPTGSSARHSDTAATQHRPAAPRTRSIAVVPDSVATDPARVVRQPDPRPVTPSAPTDISVSAAPASALVAVNTDPPAVSPRPDAQVVATVPVADGLAPSETTNPLAPVESSALLAFLAWGQRESNRTPKQTAVSTPVATAPPAQPGASAQSAGISLAAAAVPVAPNVASAKPAKPVPGNSTKSNWVTGPGITTAPFGTPGNYGVAGTDLGIMWDDGAGNVLMLFGDTFDQPGMKGVWRSNVLLRSVDHNLADKTLSIKDAVISPGGNYNANTWSNSFGATQVVRDPGFLGLFGRTTTIIPTAAISVTDADGNVTQYANVMSVRTWQTPGSWTTNWSAIASSTDGGLTWKVAPGTVRSAGFLQASVPFRSGNQNFQQGAFVMGQPTDVDARGVQYVYSYGTPAGRNGAAYLSRVPADQILSLSSYQYWGGNSKGWVTNRPSAAVAVIGGREPATGPFAWIQNLFGGVKSTVSELSIQYNEYLGQYVALYTDRSNNVVMRVSDTPQGLWSDAATLVANNLTTNSGMYAPMIHPWSGTDQLGAGNDKYLYWNLSWWGDYNVKLMQTDLSPMLTTV